MFVACGIWCLADVWSISPPSERPVYVCIQRHCSFCKTTLNEGMNKFVVCFLNYVNLK